MGSKPQSFTTTASGKQIRLPGRTPRPAAAAYAERNNVRNVTTVELTSKPLKAQGCLAGLLLMVGIGLFFGGTASGEGAMMAFGIVGMIIGLIWTIITRLRIWWHHS